MRFLPFVLTIAMTAAASAGECIPSKEYMDQGGKLDQTDAVHFYESMPLEFFTCGVLGCSGKVELKGNIGEDGTIRDMIVTRNTYGPGGEPDGKRAEMLRKWLLDARFTPPELAGKPVCVIREWEFRFETSIKTADQ